MLLIPCFKVTGLLILEILEGFDQILNNDRITSNIHINLPCLFELMLYIHGLQLRSCRDVLSTLFLGKPPRSRLPVPSAHLFAYN